MMGMPARGPAASLANGFTVSLAPITVDPQTERERDVYMCVCVCVWSW